MRKKLFAVGMVLILGLMTACGKNEENEVMLQEVEQEEAFEDELIDTPISDEGEMESEDEELVDDVSEGEEDYEYYSACTIFSKAEVEDFALTVKEQIMDKDWEGLAENIAYPITIADKTYSDKASFVEENWDHIFPANFYNSLDEEGCIDLECSSDGIVLANGLVIIGQIEESDTDVLKITSIQY